MQKNKSHFPLTATALLVAISIIFSTFVIYIPMFGFKSVRFSMTSIPIFIAGSLFGGVYGAVAGFVSDVIGFMFTSQGAPYHPGFTINATLVGLIPGMAFYYFKNQRNTMNLNKINLVLGVLALAGTEIYINFIGIHEVENLGSFMGIPMNIVLSILMVMVLILLIIIVLWVQKRFGIANGIFTIDQVIFVCILNFIVAHLILTPFWIQNLYGVPIMASVIVRIFKSLIDIPLQVALIYVVLCTLPQKVKGAYLCKNNEL